MNPSTTKKNKKGSKEIPFPKTQTSKQNDINKNKSQELNINQSPIEIKHKPKQSKQNLNLENTNQKNINANTEIKDKKRKIGNSQTLLCDLKDEINNENNSEKIKPNEKNINNNNKNKYTSNKNILSNANPFQNKDSIDSNELSLKLKNSNDVIKTKLNSFNNVAEEKINMKVKSPTNKRQLTGRIKQIKKNNNKENINQSKTVMTTTNKEDNIDDLLISDNEFDESKNSSTIKKTKYLKVSTNPFSSKITKKSLNLNIESSKNITGLKKQLNLENNDSDNINKNNENISPDNKEKREHLHHMKSTTLNIRNSISHTSIPNSSNISSSNNNLQTMTSNSKKTLNTNANTDISEHSNIENIYRKFLVLAKRGDREKFLEIFGQILSLDKNNRDINYKDEEGYSALHYACDEGNLKIVEILIDAHCNPNILNNLKQTPLHLSAKGGYFDISKKLIESGAILNVYDSEKNSPLHYICKNNYVELLKFFLTKSPQIEEKNIYGKTPKELTTNSEIKNLIDDYISKLEKESKMSKISSNEASDIISKAKSQKIDNKDSGNNLNNRNRNNTLNPKHIKNPLRNHNSKKELHPNKELQNIEIKNKKKIHSNKNNNIINAPTNSKIELNSNNNLNNSSNSSNNKSPSPDSIHKKKTIKNFILKNDIRNKEKLSNNSLTNNEKEKKDSNIYFQNTNNINNNNININIYSIEGVKRNLENSNYLDNHSINKTSEYINIDEPNLNNSNNININNSAIYKSSTSINRKLFKKNKSKPIHVSQQKTERKSKFYQNNVKTILDSIDSCEKNYFNLNKTEENIIPENQPKKIIKNNKDKHEKSMLNKSANIFNITNNNHNKTKILTANSKIIQSTEQLLTKGKPQPKKRESKFKPAIKNINDSVFNNINNMNISKISPLKKNKFISDLDIINRSNIVTHKKLLNTTSTSIEHISTSNFLCLAQLGKGSFGEVYLVKKINSEETYAMKVLRKERIMGQNLLKYAVAERNVLSTSHHPFIVKLNYAFQTSTKLFLVIEYCPNGDLSQHLSFEKRFKEPRAKFYICEILLALEDLHKRDIIFRDLKPDNVVLDKDGHCKLTDFGLSKEGVRENFYAQSFCGSIAYLAPEMLKKEGHGKAVDWYLLGVLFYEMLVGMTPYFNTRKEDIFYNIEHGELKIPNFVSKEAGELLRRLLERNPSKRLGGMGRDALEIKEHPYFKDVDWKKMYEKKIQAPHFVNYMTKTIKYYHKPRLFASDDLLNKTEEDKPMSNMLKGWSFISKDDII